MKKFTLIPVVVFSLIVLSVIAVGAQEATPETTPARSSVSLAIYNQGTALVQDRRSFTFVEGENRIDFTDVASGIDATSVTFISLTDPLGTYVLEQNYVFDLVNSTALANRYIDEAIEVVTEDGTVYNGVLLSSNGGLILRQENGQIITVSLGFIRDIRFPSLPSGLITRPTLRWTLQSATAGVQDVALTYLTSGMTWTADYNVLLAGSNESLDLNGWVTLTNTSGATYQDAQVKLIAGDVNRIYDAPMMEYLGDAMMASPAAPEQRVEQRDISEYKLYEIERLVTVANNEIKQVEFVTGADVPATTYYVYEASYPYYGGGPVYDQYYGATGTTDIATYLEFTTDEDGGLGADLPAGRVRVYQEDIDGGAILVGENTIDHTPEGETVNLYLGNAFDLVGERTQTSYLYIGTNVLEETYEIRLRNRKEDETVEIRVPENMSRWSNWEILASSQDYTQLNSNTIEFVASVEPGGETVITYTVRYTFPR